MIFNCSNIEDMARDAASVDIDEDALHSMTLNFLLLILVLLVKKALTSAFNCVSILLRIAQ